MATNRLNKDMDLAEYLQRLLNVKSWKASRLAKESGVSHVYIGYILKRLDPNTGRPPNPTADKLIDLAKGLNISPAKLIIACSGEDPDLIDSDKTQEYRNAFMAMLKELPRDEKRQLIMEMPAQELISLMPDEVKVEIVRRVQERKASGDS